MVIIIIKMGGALMMIWRGLQAEALASLLQKRVQGPVLSAGFAKAQPPCASPLGQELSKPKSLVPEVIPFPIQYKRSRSAGQ